MTGLLGAKYYVANLLNGSAAALQYMLPVIIFLVAVFLAFATGKKSPAACPRPGPQEGDACPFGCLVAREISKSLRCGEESREV